MNRGLAFVVNTTFVTEECCNCHCLFAMTDQFKRERLEDGKTFYCPNGHPQHYSQRQTQAKEIERLKREVEWTNDRLKYARAESEHFRKSRDGMKGALAKTKKRISAGVCPCCNRTVKQLAEHMKTKHPDYGQGS